MIMNPVDDGEGDDSDDGEGQAPRAGNGDEIDMEAEGQRAADSEVVDEPEARQGGAEPHPVPRPRACRRRRRLQSTPWSNTSTPRRGAHTVRRPARWYDSIEQQPESRRRHRL